MEHVHHRLHAQVAARVRRAAPRRGGGRRRGHSPQQHLTARRLCQARRSRLRPGAGWHRLLRGETPRPAAAHPGHYHADHDWPAYEARFDALLAAQPLRAILDDIDARFQRPCLLCAEPEPSKCHRRLVAEAFARIEPQLSITHLVTPKYAEAKPANLGASNGTKRSRGKGGKRSRQSEASETSEVGA